MNNNDNNYQQGNYYPEGSDNRKSEPYGAVYTPTGTPGSQQYTYIPYSGQGSYNAARTAPQPAPKKKKGHAGLIIGITCAALVLIAAITGCLLVAREVITDIINSKNYAEGTGSPDNQTAETLPLEGRIVIAGDDTNQPSGVTTTIISSGSEMPVPDVVKAVKDSVVEIRTEIVTSGRGILSQFVNTGAGSGVIISDTGLIITNNHVIEGASKITVRLTDGKEFEAELVGTDEDNDIAVISFKPGDEKLTAAVLGDSSKLEVGQSILVIGNPLGELGGTVTSGIVSCTERDIVVENSGSLTLIQTDAAVNAGNSGGGMFNLRGELVGIVNAKYSGDSIEGLGFAIPTNTAWKVADELIHYGYVRGKASLGISVLDVNNISYALYYFGSRSAGVFIVDDNDKLGVKRGDRIVALNDTEIGYSADISSFLKKCSVGDKVKMTVVRNNKTVTVDIVLTEKVPQPSN